MQIKIKYVMNQSYFLTHGPEVFIFMVIAAEEVRLHKHHLE